MHTPHEQTTNTNHDQIEYWNGQAGQKWVRLQDKIDAMFRPITQAALSLAAPRAGDHILDIGCGCGETSLQLAPHVKYQGSVLGVDISQPMIARARERAQNLDLPIEFLVADASVHCLPSAGRSLLFSRFGVMFFRNPDAAFGHLATALAPEGRLLFACWRPLQENPWMLVPLMAASEYVPLPEPPGPEEPGPGSFADPTRVRRILHNGGFDQITLEKFDTPLALPSASGLDEAADFSLQMGPTGSLLKDSTQDTRTRVAEAIGKALAPFQTPGGVVLDAAIWLVSARKHS